jgi:predicted RND superfamily exporter protein
MLDELLEKYGYFVARRPLVVFALVILMTFGAMQGASKLSMTGTSFSSMFPGEEEVIRTMRLASDRFGGTSSINIVIQLDPDQAGPTAIMDVRDPKVVQYADILAANSEEVERVISVSSVADVLRDENDGILPSSKKSIITTLDSSSKAETYVSDDYTMTLVKISLGNVDEKEEQLISDLRNVIASATPPAGIKADIAGEPMIAVIFKESTGPDMARTSKYSFIGIFIIAVLLFTSIRYGVMPIISVGIGLMWAFGLMGFMGIRISSTMAGFASMVMGIGIDFAIQVVNRYRIEKDGIFNESVGKHTPEEALVKTLSSTFRPMATTTLAALIGFRAMSLGQLTIMSDLGNVMSLGVLACAFTAFMLVPSLLMITEKVEKVVR